MKPFFSEMFLFAAVASTGAVVLSWVVAFFLRRQSAALRHFVWLLALAAPLGILPLAALHARIALPVLPPSRELSPAPESFAKPEQVASSDSVQVDAVSLVHAVPSRSVVLKPAWQLPFNLADAAWILGAGFLVAYIVLSQARVRRLVREKCSPGPKTLVRRMEKAGTYFWFTRPVRLLVTPLTEIPFCVGLIRPTVIFPESWLEWDEERIEICLTHELAHIARRDLLAMAIGQLACVVCWFNPLVWYAAGRLRDEAENAADDLVLGRDIRPETYAANLVAITEKFRATSLSPIIALSMARPNRLTARVQSILDATVCRRAPGRAMFFATGFLAAVVLAVVMTVRLTAAPVSEGAGQEKDLTHVSREMRDVVWEALFKAIKAGDIQTVESYLDRGLDVNVDLVSNSSLLYTAVSDQQVAIVKLFLAKGADVSQKTSWGDTAVKRASWLGNKEIADLLIAAGAKPDEWMYVTGMGDVAALEALDKKQPVTPKQARGLIDCAVSSGQLKTFDWLWTKQGPLDDTQKDKLLGDLYEQAGKWGQLGILQHLETLGATPAKFGSRALVNAASRNFPDIVKHLLDAGVPPNVLPPKWNPMLRDAAGEGYLEIVKLLLDHGADINARDEQGLTPLSWAAYRQRDEICKLLLERGADGNIENDQKENAAWYASYIPDVLEAMIKKGVKVTSLDKSGDSILQAMMMYSAPGSSRVAFPGRIYTDAETAAYDVNQRRVVELLVAAGAKVDGPPGTIPPLMLASQTGHYAAASALIDQGANVNEVYQGNTALNYLFMYSFFYTFPADLLEDMLKHGGYPKEQADAGAPGSNTISLLDQAVALASSKDPKKLAALRQAVQVLLKYDAVFPGVKNEHNQALLQAASRGDTKQMEDVIAQGASIDVTAFGGMNALMVSSSMGYWDQVRWLLDHGADAKIGGWNGESLLRGPVIMEQPEMVDLLISKGAKGNAGDLDCAVRAGNQRIFEAVLKSGANPKQADIFICIQNGQAAMAKTLLDGGANPQPPARAENRGNVYWAVYYDQGEILKMLLDHGADPTLKDYYGDMPLTSAQKFHKDLVPTLEEALKNWPAGKK